MHELENISDLETLITKKIVDYKLRILTYLDDYAASLNMISINRKNGYLKIETRNTLPDKVIHGLESSFNIALDFKCKVAVDTNELYNYIFKPV